MPRGCSYLSCCLVTQSLSHVWFLAAPWTAASQASLFFTVSWNLLQYLSIESVMPSNHIILCCPLMKICNVNSNSLFLLKNLNQIIWASQVVLVVRNPPANARDIRDTHLMHELGRCPGPVHGNPLQYSCLENPLDRGAWQAIVHRVAKRQTRLKWLITHATK